MAKVRKPRRALGSPGGPRLGSPGGTGKPMTALCPQVRGSAGSRIAGCPFGSDEFHTICPRFPLGAEAAQGAATTLIGLAYSHMNRRVFF